VDGATLEIPAELSHLLDELNRTGIPIARPDVRTRAVLRNESQLYSSYADQRHESFAYMA
jgi:hypothetical protein